MRLGLAVVHGVRWLNVALAAHQRRAARDAAHALERLAGDVLHKWDGALADERNGHRVGADAMACDPAGSVGDVGSLEDVATGSAPSGGNDPLCLNTSRAPREARRP